MEKDKQVRDGVTGRVITENKLSWTMITAFELDEYINRSEINNNEVETVGEVTVSPYGTYEVFTPIGFVNRFDVECAYNLQGQVGLNVKQDIEQGKEIAKHDTRLDRLEDEVSSLTGVEATNILNAININ